MSEACSALGVGILIDARIGRALLVSGLVAVFGTWNWWPTARLGRSLAASVASIPAMHAAQSNEDAATEAGPLARLEALLRSW